MTAWLMAVALAASQSRAGVLSGYVPFRDPLPIDRYWMLLLIPLVVGIAVVYKAIKIHDIRKLPRQSALLAVQIVVFMLLAAAALWLLTELV